MPDFLPRREAELLQWAKNFDRVFGRNTTRTTSGIEFPHPLPPGAQVWVTACWINPTSQRGPSARPVSTRVFGGWAMAA